MITHAVIGTNTLDAPSPGEGTTHRVPCLSREHAYGDATLPLDMSHTHIRGRLEQSLAQRTRNVMRGCIQAVDGLLIKIKTPSQAECAKQHSFHTRKDVEALLLIASCDADSIFHWGSMCVVGSTHDISAYYQ